MLIPAAGQTTEANNSVLSNVSGRRSGLLAPTMLLTGHQGEIFALEFSRDGRSLATAGFDKNILLWDVYGECQNWGCLSGHKSAVLEIHHTTDGSHLISCSADKSVMYWNLETTTRLKKLAGHSEVVNSCQTARRGAPLVVSGADDGTCRIWDLRTRKAVRMAEHQFQILSVSFDDCAERVFAGSLDGTIRVYDLRKEETAVSCLEGHADCVTGLDVSSCGNYLLSNAMDKTVRKWDIRYFVPNESERCVALLAGVAHNFEKNLLRVRWSPDDKWAAAGSSDRLLKVWDVSVAHPVLTYQLPGHSGTINEVVFHPTEPVVGSGGNDKKVFLGELGE